MLLHVMEKEIGEERKGKSERLRPHGCNINKHADVAALCVYLLLVTDRPR